MTRTMVANLVTGVSEGFKKELEINGVGYRAADAGQRPETGAGLQPRCEFRSARGCDCDRAKPTEIIVEGIDQQLVGQVAANIREWRKPEPYKGKGIKYKGEFIFRKEGKKK